MVSSDMYGRVGRPTPRAPATGRHQAHDGRRERLKAHYGEGFRAERLGGQVIDEILCAEGGADGAAHEAGRVEGAGFIRASTDCRAMPGPGL